MTVVSTPACSSRMAAVWRSVCGGMFIVWVGRIALGFAILPSVQEQRQQRAVVRSRVIPWRVRGRVPDAVVCAVRRGPCACRRSNGSSGRSYGQRGCIPWRVRGRVPDAVVCAVVTARPMCHPGRPDLALTGRRLARATPPAGLPVLRPFPSSTRAAAITPAEPVGARVARFPTAGSLPRNPGGSASALPVSRPARRLLAL